MDRRQSLGLMGCLMASVAWAKQSHATTARAVSLHELVQRSTRVARGTPLENSMRMEDIGGSRHIVTYTRLRVDELLHGAHTESEILVRTLGGRVGDVGEVVSGEAELQIEEGCVVFLQTDPDGVELVTAMAQGHYPMAIDAAGVPRLRASRNMPHLIRSNTSAGAVAAVSQLSGVRINEARDLILGAR